MMRSVPVLLDCTRMFAQHVTGRLPTGIDRVCAAYRTHFAARAQAVVQWGGHTQVLTRTQSERLFAMWERPRSALRDTAAALAACAGSYADNRKDVRGAIYLNVSHSGYDLARHGAWVHRSGVRPVYLVHDLIPIEHPHWTTPHKVGRHTGRVTHALAAADGIIANSHHTARALHRFAQHLGLEPPPILGAPLATGSPRLPRHAAGMDQPTFVCVSTIEHRKNHSLLLDVWHRLIELQGESAPRLVLIGRWGVGAEEVRRRYRADPNLRRFVHIHTNCTDAAVARHLQTACALLAPSRAEGFGLPVIEALAAGVPVIASDIPAFRDVGAGVPTFLDPDWSEGWIAAIRQFAANCTERQRQLAALTAFQPPRWADHFALVDHWLEDLPTRIPKAVSRGRSFAQRRSAAAPASARA